MNDRLVPEFVNEEIAAFVGGIIRPWDDLDEAWEEFLRQNNGRARDRYESLEQALRAFARESFDRQVRARSQQLPPADGETPT